MTRVFLDLRDRQKCRFVPTDVLLGEGGTDQMTMSPPISGFDPNMWRYTRHVSLLYDWGWLIALWSHQSAQQVNATFCRFSSVRRLLQLEASHQLSQRISEILSSLSLRLVSSAPFEHDKPVD